MGRIQRFFNQIIGFFGGGTKAPPDISTQLSPETLARALKEAQFLKTHAVHVEEASIKDADRTPESAGPKH